MLKGIRKFFAPPELTDAKITQAAAILNPILHIFSGASTVSIIYGIVTVIANQEVLPADFFLLGIAIGSLVFSIFLRALMHRGMVRFVSGLITTFVLLVVWVNSAQYGGLNSLSTSGFVLVVVIAGLLLGTSGSLLFTGLSILGSFALNYLQSTGMIGKSLPTTPHFSDWFVYALVLVMSALIVSLANRHIRTAQAQAQQSQQIVDERTVTLSETQNALKEDRLILAEQSNKLERYSRYLEASAAITRTATTSRDPQQFLDRIAMLISEEFGHYHTGIFLVDEANEWAMLTAASSPGGNRLIVQEHRVQVGKQSVVGFVTGLGQAHIAQNTTSDSLFLHQSELPATNSEIALPLKVSGEVIGAIDIQDMQLGRFGEDDIPTFQSLTDQIALIINNHRLQTQAQQNIAEMQKLYGEISQAVWAEQHGISGAYRFAQGQVEALKNIPETEALITDESQKNVVKLPIRVRGNVVGYIDIVRQTDAPALSAEEKELMDTLSDQLGIAMESASLFQESQRLATDERLVSEVSARIRETLDINTILKTAAAEIRQATGLQEVTVRLATDTPTNVHRGNGHK